MKRLNGILIRFILTAIMIVVYTCFAGAQNSGRYPYLDSEHAYQIVVGKETNSRTWVITNTVDPDITLTNALDYVDIDEAESDGGVETIEIYFDRAIFTTGTWLLRYSETEANTGTCISNREFQIDILENSFTLVLGTDAAECPDESGQPHTYAEVTGTNYPATIRYSVNMSKGADYSPTSWYFTATFDAAPTAAPTVSILTADGGTPTVTGSGTTYTITIDRGVNPFPNSVNIAIDASFNGLLSVTASPLLTVSDGHAVVAYTPPTPNAMTEDNISVNNDREQELTVNALPVTHNIVEGPGESVWSAEHPLQNSTHNYNVEMEDFTNNTSAWRIENLDGSQTMTLGTHYQLATTNAGNVVTAEITFLGAMATGDYYIYFTETDPVTTCSSLRRKLIHLLEPFDVDIALSTGEEVLRCATISGEPLSELEVGVATDTEVQFTATMKTTGYDAGWSFDISVVTAFAGGFTAADVELTAGAIVVTGGTYTAADNYHGSVVVAAGTTSVDITVTFSGLYVNRHDITVALSNITGSFDEDDDGTGNSVVHTIYRMPQTGILAGVD